jgi:Putative Ig domain
MKRSILLTTSILLALSGCGSDSGEDPLPKSDENSNPATKVITAIDGYLINAKVITDTNNNNVLDSEDSILGWTDENGQFDISLSYENATVFIETVKGETIDSNRGLITQSFTLAADGGDNVISPLTNMVVELLAADATLTLADAQQQVSNTIKDLGIESALLFGDYLQDDSEVGIALTIIGEQLVDNNQIAIERKLELVTAFSTELQNIIESDSETLALDYYPVVDIPSDDNAPITVKTNHRPTVSSPLEDVTMTFGQEFSPLSVSGNFIDQDNDLLTYSITEINGLSHSLTISLDGEISGTIATAASYHFQIITTDSFAAQSYPLDLKVDVQSLENTLPVLSKTEHTRIQSLISEWELTEGQYIDYIIDMSQLFEDNDELTYRADSTLSIDESSEKTDFTMTITGSSLTFNAAPSRKAEAGIEKLTIWASDGVNAEEAYAIFDLPVILAKVEVDPIVDPVDPVIPAMPPHFLEKNSSWYYSRNSACNLITFTAGFLNDTVRIFSEVDPIEENSYQCFSPTDQSNSVISETRYVIDDNNDNLLKSENYDTDGVSFELIHQESVEDVFAGVSQGMIPSIAVVRRTKLNAKTGELDFRLLTLHDKKDAIEKTLMQPASIGDELSWATQTVWAAPDAIGGLATSMIVEAAIQQYEISGEIHSKAIIRTTGVANCERLDRVYGNVINVAENTANPASEFHFTALTQFEDNGNYCSVSVVGLADYSSNEGDPSGAIPTGEYHMQSYPSGYDFTDEIIEFSFIVN